MTNEEIADMIAASIEAMVERPDVTAENVVEIATLLVEDAAVLFSAIGGLEYAADEIRRVADDLAGQAMEGPCSSSGS